MEDLCLTLYKRKFMNTLATCIGWSNYSDLTRPHGGLVREIPLFQAGGRLSWEGIGPLFQGNNGW